MTDLNKSIAIAVKTGKVFFGMKDALRSAKIGRARLIIVTSNSSEEFRRNLEYYCKLSRIPLIIYSGNSLDLGAVCGKPFLVSALTVREAGDSDILNVAVTENV